MRERGWTVGCILVAVSGFAQALEPSDPDAVRVAEAVLERLGGRQAWEETRFVRWDFFGGRRHWWDRATGDIRIEYPDQDRVVLMNVDTKQGRVFDAGGELPDGPERAAALQQGHEVWINDSYWMFMPYKLLDPGVRLRSLGERSMEDGRAADVLEMTFENVGYTPENKYEIFVAKETGLIEQWTFYSNATDAEPRFTLPWHGWRRFGAIWLATDHGQDKDWSVGVPEHIPESIFREPVRTAG